MQAIESLVQNKGYIVSLFNNMSDNFEMGCGTGIKWNFIGAKYPKGTKLIKDGLIGEIILCYHYGEGSKHTYFVKWPDNKETEISEERIHEYIIKK